MNSLQDVLRLFESKVGLRSCGRSDSLTPSDRHSVRTSRGIATLDRQYTVHEQAT